MNELFHWGGHPVVQRLGWTLVHFLWQGAVIAALFALAQTNQAKRSSNARYWTGCVCLLLMMAGPTVTYLTLGPQRPSVAALSARQSQAEASSVKAPTPVKVSAPLVPEGKGNRPAVLSPNPDLNPAPSTARHAEEFIRIFVLCWFVGVSVLSLRLLVSSLQVAHLKRRDNEPLDEPCMTRLDRLKAALQISRPVRLAKSLLVEVPTVVGWLRPVILLPAASLMGLTAEQLESILAHELAHIRRHDYLVNLFQNVLETLLFYHPAVWWISSCVRAEREICCDEIAVRLCGDRLVYAQALTTLEELRGGPAFLALGANGGSLLQRIRHLSGASAGEAFSSRRRTGGAVVAALVALIFIFLLHYPSENAKGQTGDIAREPRPSQGAFLKAGGIAAQKSQGSEDNEGSDIVFDDLALPLAIWQLGDQAGLKIQFDPLLFSHEIPRVNEKWKNVSAAQALQALLINYGLETEQSPSNLVVRIHARRPDTLRPPVAEVNLLNAPPPNVVPGINFNNNDEVIDLKLDGVSLPDAIRTLADQISLNIQFDPALIKQNEPHVNEPLKKNVSTRHAIQELLDKYGWRLTRIPGNPILRVVASNHNLSAGWLSPGATSGVLLDVYDGFLQDGNSNVFCSFEREQLIPKKLSGAHEIQTADGQKALITYEDNREYRAICRCGRYFVAAYSGKGPFQEPADIPNAEVLMGFDGSYYWNLTLATTALDTPSVSTVNRLVLVPVSEAARPQGMYQADITLKGMKFIEQECASAVQFGYPDDLAKPPQRNVTNLLLEGLDGATENAEVAGSIEEPDEIDYFSGADLRRAVALNSPTDTMTITCLQSKEIYSQERIRFIAFAQSFRSPAPSIFAWQTYKGAAKNLRARLITNGMHMEVIFASPSSTNFRLGRLTQKAEPMPSP